MLGSTCSSRSVYILLVRRRRVKHNYELNLGEIQPSCSNICAEQTAGFLSNKLIINVGSLFLINKAVQFVKVLLKNLSISFLIIYLQYEIVKIINQVRR